VAAIVVIVIGAVAVGILSGGGAGSPAASGSPGGSGGPGGSASAPASPAGSGAAPSGTPGTNLGSRFPGGLLIADRANGRLLVVDSSGKIIWHFPAPGVVPAGESFNADDAFIAPDGKTIVANDEDHMVIDRIDIATGQIVWQYGHYGKAGSAAGYLNTPDDAYPLANGDVIVADIVNCRIIEISPAKEIVKMWGKTGVCKDDPPLTYGAPNGDTPLPDGGLLITEIYGSRVVRLAADGTVVFNIHVPVAYPSDAQIDRDGNIVVADYSSIGQVVCVTPTGKLVWRYRVTSGAGRLNHPSLATPLPDGTVVVNDDDRQRMVVIDPATLKIVWQYGQTDVAGTGPGQLSDPDGHDPLPAGIVFP
jgi:outer membrane protein assembly factor BamB